MRILNVPLEYTNQVWTQVEGYLERAFDYAEGDYTVQDARVYVTSGLWHLVIAEAEDGIKGAALVMYFNRPRDRIAFVLAMGGRLITSSDTFNQFKGILRANGATCIEGAARDDILRLWAKFGVVKKYNIISASI